MNVPRAWRAGGRIGARRRPGAAAHERGHAGKQGFVDLLGTDEMHVHVDTASRDDLPFAGDDFGAWSDDDRDALLDIGISSFANRCNPAVLDADVGLHDSPVIEDQGIGDHGVDRAVDSSALRLSHPVADDFAAAEFHLLPVRRKVLLDLDDEVGICQTHPIADGRAEHLCVRGTAHYMGHGVSTLSESVSRLRLRQCAHHLLVEPEPDPRSAVRHEPHLAGLARLETHSRSRGDVEAISGGCVSIERQRGIRLSEMKVTANLNRSVAGVCYPEHDGRPVRIQENLAGSRKEFPRYHGNVPRAPRATIATMAPNAATAPAARNAILGIEPPATRHSPMPAV